jgi:hypothetical protein
MDLILKAEHLQLESFEAFGNDFDRRGCLGAFL